jgi:hypothetical protein
MQIVSSNYVTLTISKEQQGLRDPLSLLLRRRLFYRTLLYLNPKQFRNTNYPYAHPAIRQTPL